MYRGDRHEDYLAPEAPQQSRWPGSGDRARASSPGSTARDTDRRPMLLWCDGRHEDAKIDELADNFRHRKILHFPTPVKFTRWLFQQRRGDITPWAVLVAGWREAKPCLLAIRAAHTGEVDCLRPDARRPELRAHTSSSWSTRRSGDTRANIAVAKIIVVVEKPQQELRIQSWIQTEMADLLDFQIELAHSLAEVVELSTHADTVQTSHRNEWRQLQGAGGSRRGAGGGAGGGMERAASDAASSTMTPASAQGQGMQTIQPTFHPQQMQPPHHHHQQQQQQQQHQQAMPMQMQQMQHLQSMQPMQQMQQMQHQQPVQQVQQQQQNLNFQQQQQQHQQQHQQQQQQQQQQPVFHLQSQHQSQQHPHQQQQQQTHSPMWSGGQAPVPLSGGCYNNCSSGGSPLVAGSPGNNSTFCPMMPYCSNNAMPETGGCCMMQGNNSNGHNAGGAYHQPGFYVVNPGAVAVGPNFPGQQDGQTHPGSMMQAGPCVPVMGESHQASGAWNRMRTLSPVYTYRGGQCGAGDASSESSQENTTAAPLPQFSSGCSNNNNTNCNTNCNSYTNNNNSNCAVSTFSNSTNSTTCNSCGNACLQQPNSSASAHGPSILSLEARQTAPCMQQSAPAPVANPRSTHYFGSAPLIGSTTYASPQVQTPGV